MAKKNLASKALSLLLALMLVVSCANITALAARPGQGSDSSSVDHIDIGVSLTADIMIDGVLYEDLTYTLNRSDLTAENLKVYSSQGGHTYSLSSVSTSTGSSAAVSSYPGLLWELLLKWLDDQCYNFSFYLLFSFSF